MANKSLKLSRWDPRDHQFLMGVIDKEHREMVPLKAKAEANKDHKVKPLWAPPSGRDAIQPSGEYSLKWPQFDSSRPAQKLIQSKRVVKIPLEKFETLPYRPNGCDQWFANVGPPPPSVRVGGTSRSRVGTGRTDHSMSSRSKGAPHMDTSRSSQRSGGPQSTARSTSSLQDWERSSAELWDRKLELERELKVVEEQQSELLGNHVARMNKIMFNRPL